MNPEGSFTGPSGQLCPVSGLAQVPLLPGGAHSPCAEWGVSVRLSRDPAGTEDVLPHSLRGVTLSTWWQPHLLA